MSSILDRIDEIEASMEEREAESNSAKTGRRAGGSEGDLIRSLDEDLAADPGEDTQADLPEPDDGLEIVDFSDLPDEPSPPQPEQKPASEKKAPVKKKRDKKTPDKKKSDKKNPEKKAPGRRASDRRTPDRKASDHKVSDQREGAAAAEAPSAKQETTADRYTMDLQKSFASFKQGLQDDLKELNDETGMDRQSMRRKNARKETEDRRENFSSDRIYAQEQAGRDETAAKSRAAFRMDAVYAKPVNFDDLVFEEAELFEETADGETVKSRQVLFDDDQVLFDDDLFEEEFEQEERPASRSRTTVKTTGGSRKKLRVILLIVIIVIAVLLVIFWLNAFGVF